MQFSPLKIRTPGRIKPLGRDQLLAVPRRFFIKAMLFRNLSLLTMKQQRAGRKGCRVQKDCFFVFKPLHSRTGLYGIFSRQWMAYAKIFAALDPG
jgi:hypothetical protein